MRFKHCKLCFYVTGDESVAIFEEELHEGGRERRFPVELEDDAVVHHAQLQRADTGGVDVQLEFEAHVAVVDVTLFDVVGPLREDIGVTCGGGEDAVVEDDNGVAILDHVRRVVVVHCDAGLWSHC